MAGGVFLMNTHREKRSRALRVRTFPSLAEQLELFRAQKGTVVSMSDYLHEVIEEHVAMRIVKQQIGRRVSNS